MGEANVFNTFSFNKWAEQKKEEEIDKETKARRHEQIRRLKDKLRKERALREAGMGDGDLDMDALIEAIQNAQHTELEDDYEETVIEEESQKTSSEPEKPIENPPEKKKERPDMMSDDYVLSEVRKYQHDHPDGGDYAKKNAEENIKPPPTPQSRPPSRKSWEYNRRFAGLDNKENSSKQNVPEKVTSRTKEVPSSKRPETPKVRPSSFKYNRKVTKN